MTDWYAGAYAPAYQTIICIVTSTRCRIDTIILLMMARGCPKHVENRNKYIWKTVIQVGCLQGCWGPCLPATWIRSVISCYVALGLWLSFTPSPATGVQRTVVFTLWLHQLNCVVSFNGAQQGLFHRSTKVWTYDIDPFFPPSPPLSIFLRISLGNKWTDSCECSSVIRVLFLCSMDLNYFTCSWSQGFLLSLL